MCVRKGLMWKKVICKILSTNYCGLFVLNFDLHPDIYFPIVVLQNHILNFKRKMCSTYFSL